jgi:uncharacterized protein YkwD
MACCCGTSDNPIAGDELHGYTPDELLNNESKRNTFSDKCFKTFDVNKNNVLEKREMQHAAVHLMNTFKHTHHVSMSDKEFKKIWEETDENGDGAVDKKEFRKYMKRVIDQTLSRATKHGKAKNGKAAKPSKAASKTKAKKKSDSDEDDADESEKEEEDASEKASSDADEDEEEEELSEQEESDETGSPSASSGSASPPPKKGKAAKGKAAAKGGKKGGDDAELEEFIETHNNLREKHGCDPLKHDAALSASAMKWAKQMAKEEKMYHSTAMADGVGENLFCGTNKDFTPKEATEAWYNEIDLYDFSNPGFSTTTGHFTALIWKDVSKVGYAKFKSKQGKLFIVGHYSPAPNMLGEFEENVPALV